MIGQYAHPAKIVVDRVEDFTFGEVVTSLPVRLAHYQGVNPQKYQGKSMIHSIRVCIAGGRDFDDYQLARQILDKCFFSISVNVHIVSGGARGADSLGIRYAREHGLPLKIYRADWQKFGKRAGMLRNAEMAKNSECLIAFWDGQSHGTDMMVRTMAKLKKNLVVFDYEGRLNDYQKGETGIELGVDSLFLQSNPRLGGFPHA